MACWYSTQGGELVWYFTMYSEGYGAEDFGPYLTRRMAIAGAKRVLGVVMLRDDGIERCFTQPFKMLDSEGVFDED